MPDVLMARLWARLLATSPLEALAVLSSPVYVVRLRRNHIVTERDPIDDAALEI
jgi:hypothetical protein